MKSPPTYLEEATKKNDKLRLNNLLVKPPRHPYVDLQHLPNIDVSKRNLEKQIKLETSAPVKQEKILSWELPPE